MTTYTSIIAALDNSNYIGKINQPIRRENYRADITIETSQRLYTRTVFAASRLALMREEQNIINNITNSEQRRYNRDLKNGYIDEDEMMPELLNVKIIETDRMGYMREM